jgi:DNA primase small subunit
MPHSVSPEDPSASDHDAMIAEAETDNGEIQATGQTVFVGEDVGNEDSQTSNVGDQDMTMEDAGVEGEDVPQIKTEVKPEVKLEDLFADIESDEEFPSSTGQNVKIESSPEAPSSPV